MHHVIARHVIKSSADYGVFGPGNNEYISNAINVQNLFALSTPIPQVNLLVIAGGLFPKISSISFNTSGVNNSTAGIAFILS